MSATVVQITNWARPHVGRQVHQVKRRTRIDTQLRKMGLISGYGRSMKRHKPFVVTPNGNDYILQDDWKRCLGDDEVMLIIAAPPTGGGGGSRILAVLAIVALSIVTAGAAAYAYAATVAATTGLSVATAGALVSGVVGTVVSVAGSMRMKPALPKAVHA